MRITSSSTVAIGTAAAAQPHLPARVAGEVFDPRLVARHGEEQQGEVHAEGRQDTVDADERPQDKPVDKDGEQDIATVVPRDASELEGLVGSLQCLVVDLVMHPYAPVLRPARGTPRPVASPDVLPDLSE